MKKNVDWRGCKHPKTCNVRGDCHRCGPLLVRLKKTEFRGHTTSQGHPSGPAGNHIDQRSQNHRIKRSMHLKLTLDAKTRRLS